MSGNDSYTVLLLHFDQDTPSYVDSSSHLHVMSPADYPIIDTANKKFGYASLQMIAYSGAGVTTPESTDWNFGTGDCTVDFWLNAYSLANTQGAYRSIARTGIDVFIVSNGTTLTVSFWDHYSYQEFTFTPDPYTFYHVAFVRYGNVRSVYLNGTYQVGNTASTAIDSSDTVAFVGSNGVGCEVYSRIDEYRVSKGIARWTSNFTPPSSAYSPDYLGGSISESEAVTSAANYVFKAFASVAESIAPSDSIHYTYRANLSLSEVVTPSDSDNYIYRDIEHLVESVSSSDGSNSDVNVYASASESESVSDVSNSIVLIVASVYEGIVINDSCNVDITSLHLGESVDQSDACSFYIEYIEDLVEIVLSTDSEDFSFSFGMSLAEVVVISDLCNGDTQSRSVVESLVSSDDIVGELTSQVGECEEVVEVLVDTDYTFEARERDVLETSYFSDYVDSATAVVVNGSISESISLSSGVNVTVSVTILGKLNCVTDSPSIEIVAIDGCTAELAVSSSVSTLKVNALQEALGRVECYSKSAEFGGLGICGSLGELKVVGSSDILSVFSGAVGITGSIKSSGFYCEVAFEGSVENLGAIDILNSSSYCNFEGVEDSTGTISLVGISSIFSLQGLTEVVSVINCEAFVSTFNAAAIVDVTGKLSATEELLRFIANGSLDIFESLNTFCLNLFKKGLVSTFTNYRFNSYANINGVLFGAKSSGMYSLTGELDALLPINAKITWPVLKLGTTNTKQVRAIKYFGRLDDSAEISVNDDGELTWNISLFNSDRDIDALEISGYFPFTARGEYLQFELDNVNGSDFLLDRLELAFYVLGRM